MNLKFNRSLFRDVSRECSLEGKFEAVINRNNPAFLLKLDGKDKTVFTQQVSGNTETTMEEISSLAFLVKKKKLVLNDENFSDI